MENGITNSVVLKFTDFIVAFPIFAVIVIVMCFIFFLQRNNFKQIKEIQENNNIQTATITKATIEYTNATTILAASTMGKEIVSGINPNLILQQAELGKINEQIIGLKQEIKNGNDKDYEFTRSEFDRLSNEIKILGSRLDKVFLAKSTNPKEV